MATLFYLVLIFFAPQATFNWFWFFISIIFSLLETGTRVIYRYTSDRSLAGHEEEV